MYELRESALYTQTHTLSTGLSLRFYNNLHKHSQQDAPQTQLTKLKQDGSKNIMMKVFKIKHSSADHIDTHRMYF